MARKLISFIAATILFAALIAGPLFLVKRAQILKIGHTYASMPQPPTVVTASPAKDVNWESIVSTIGTVTPVQGVTVGTQVAGMVVKIEFEPGASVKEGDVLVKLDTSVEEAQLDAAEAAAALAKANLQRARELRANNTNSAAELDAAVAQAKQADAEVENLRAVIDKKTVRAPFSGRLGIRLVNLGQILKEGDPIVELQTLDPIYVNFSLPQQQVGELGLDSIVRLHTDAAPGQTFEGKVTAVNPLVDPTTRNFRVQATLENHEGKLRAGMFTDVDVVLPKKHQVLIIPATSVLYAPYGDTVFVVDEQKDEKTGKTEQVLRQQVIQIEESRGDFVAVRDGLKPGEMVVTSGAFKLRKGMPVVIDNSVAPKPELAPKPNNT